MTAQKRIYKDGRPTDGWKRGKRIASLEEMKPGTVLINVNHQFKAENLLKAIENPETPSQVQNVQFCTPSGDLIDSENQRAVWDFDLKHHEIEEFFLAEKIETAKPPAKNSGKGKGAAKPPAKAKGGAKPPAKVTPKKTKASAKK